MLKEPKKISASQLAEAANLYIAGGVVSLNRKVDPHIVFASAMGSYLWDHAGNRYLDYHAAFAPHLLGHNFPAVTEAVLAVLRENRSLVGTGTSELEVELAARVCGLIPSCELIQITNTGSEATAHAIRLSRAFTGREDIIVIAGGYNGWHNEVSRAVMPSLEATGPRVSPGEYRFVPLSAGIPEATKRAVHIVNFNDLASVEYVMRRFPVACVLTEPVLQNIGVVLPDEGYLEGLVALCRQYGAVSVFDEVKTGFRTAPGGYQGVAGVRPDLSVFGKAVANGYPLGIIGGRRDIMGLFDAPDPARRVLIAGTYNAHPVNVAAAIATIDTLVNEPVHAVIRKRCGVLYEGLVCIFREAGIPMTLARNESAFCMYFMDTMPRDLHDILTGHDFAFDLTLRKELIAAGIYHIPVACKQGSVSYAHSAEDVEFTLDVTRSIVRKIQQR